MPDNPMLVVSTPCPAAGAAVQPRSAGRIPGLDALRALAILLVVIYHYDATLVHYSPRGQLGPFGVTIFFVLSGYLITSMLVAEYKEKGDVSLRRFYRNRAIRLLPVFYICWLVSSAVILYRGIHLSGWEWFASAFYLMDYARATAAPAAFHNIGIAWSLAIEEQFYLIWPVVLVWLLRKRWHPGRVLGVTIAVIWLYRSSALISGWASPTYVYNAFEMRMDALLVGCATVFMPRERPATEPAWTALLTLILLLTMGERLAKVPLMAAGVYAVEPILIADVMMFLIGCNWRWLKSRAIAFVAAVSYSLYLVHGVLLDHIGSIAGHRLRYVVLLTVIPPVLLLYGVERPLARRRKRLG